MHRERAFPLLGRVIFQALVLLALAWVAMPSFGYHYTWDQNHATSVTNPIFAPPAGPEDRAPCDSCNKNGASRPMGLGSPVYVSAGHAIWSDTDAVLRGRTFMGVVRSYNSNDPVIGLFGNGWTVNFDVALYPANSGGQLQRIYKAANGKRFIYVRQPDGSYKAPAARFETVVEGPSSVTMTALDGSRQVFALDGRLLERYDSNNNRLAFSHDSAARPIRIEDGNGRVLTIAYNGAGFVDSVRDQGNRTWRYAYDGAYNLVTVTNPAGAATTYRYQAYRPAGEAHTYQQLLSVMDPTGVYAVQFTYSGSQVASYTKGANRYTYSRNLANTKLSGTVTRTDSMGATKTLVYGSLGLVTRETDALGNATAYLYDTNGMLVQTTDPLSRNWVATYDTLGRLLTSSNPLTQTTTLGYQGNDPRPVSLTSPTGRVVSLSYDAQGNLLTLTNPAGAITRLSYSSRGDLITLKNSLNQTATFGYSALGLPLTATDPLGRVTTLAYDNLGRLIQMTNPAGETTQFAYDLLDRALTITDALNQQTSFTYDAAGRLTGVTDAKGSVTQYQYDSYGRRIAELAPDGRKTQYTYRNDNLLDHVTWPDNTTLYYQYDGNKRVTRETAGSEVTTYAYNAVNQLLSATGPGGTVTYTYDDAGRVATETSAGYTHVITRNAEGEPIQLDALGQTTTYMRDRRGLITRINSSTAGAFVFAFDGLGRRTRLTYPNGSTASYAYDAAGQLSSLTHSGVFNAPYAYTYDVAGRVTRITGDGADWTYAYDALGRLIRAVHGAQTYAYAWDAVGNVLDSERVYDVNHRIVADAANSYTYDQRGNLTLEQENGGGRRVVYLWNSKNQLKQLDFYPTSSGATYTRRLVFEYDPIGRRSAKTDLGVTRRFSYRGPDLIGVLDVAGMVGAVFGYSSRVDEPIFRAEAGASSYLHANHLGSIVAVSEAGLLSASRSYSPFGQSADSTSFDVVPFGFTGRERDTDALYYYRARYMNAAMGRFIQRDPIGLSGGINPYAYVEGNPISKVDPLGLLELGLLRHGEYLDSGKCPESESEVENCDRWVKENPWGSWAFHLGFLGRNNYKEVRKPGQQYTAECTYQGGRLQEGGLFDGSANAYADNDWRHTVWDRGGIFAFVVEAGFRLITLPVDVVGAAFGSSPAY